MRPVLANNPATYCCTQEVPWVFILSYRRAVIVTSTSLSSLDTSLLNSTEEVDCAVATWLTVFARASTSHFLALCGCSWRFLSRVMNSLYHTISESCNFMAYFGRCISSLSRYMPSRLFGLTSLGPPLNMGEMRRIPPSGRQTGEVDHFS